MPTGHYIRTPETLAILRASQARVAASRIGSRRLDMLGARNVSHRPEVRAKISLALRGRPSANKGKSNYWLLGEKNQNWKGGITVGPDNRRRYNAYKANERYSMLKGATGGHAIQEWEDLKKQHDYTCLGCGRCEPEIKLTKDHIIPVTRGGTNDIGNLQPLCGSCNSRKSNKLNYHV